MNNPYAVPNQPPRQEGLFGEHASKEAGTFLYRVIEIRKPIPMQFVYSGWWFRQTVEINGDCVWGQISWLSIKKEAEFALPVSIDPSRRRGRLEIDFSRGLQIRRFRIWIDGESIYDEVTS